MDGTPDAPTQALLARIAALRAKTTERGCTEHEAMAAAAKVAELLDRHGLSMSELELQSQACAKLMVPTGRRRAGPVDECLPAVASFCGCRSWFQTDAEGQMHWVLFGLPADVEAAHYLMDLVVQAFETEGNRYRRSAAYLRGRGGARRALTTSFVLGMAHGVTARLRAMQDAREAALNGASGRDLVVAKAGVVDAELGKLGLRFRTRRVAERMVNTGAFDRGQEAGERFEVRPGVKN